MQQRWLQQICFISQHWKLQKYAYNMTSFSALRTLKNSLFWDTDPLIELFALCPGYHNVFQSCMMGGERDKRTKWWSSKANFAAFNILCNGAHQHKPWKPVQTESGLHFPTAEEAAYPPLLCERVAHVIKEAAEAMGIKQTESFSTTDISGVATC